MFSRNRGIIKVWNDEKGYGFIAPTTGAPDLFFHITSVTNSHRRDLTGQRVTYDLNPGRDGKPSAVDVRLATAPEEVALRTQFNRRGSSTGLTIAFIITFIYFAAVTFISRSFFFPCIPAAYFGLSLLTYHSYGIDKYYARTNQWRTPEAHLHLMELLGGWPGALIAQWNFSHKNRKTSYQVAFWFIVIIHVTAVIFIINYFEILEKLNPASPASISIGISQN